MNNQIAELKKEAQKLVLGSHGVFVEASLLLQLIQALVHLERVVEAEMDNTGHEPSLSCFHRAIYAEMEDAP